VDLSSTERQALKRAIEVCCDAAVIYPLVQKFANMVRSREAEDLKGWLEESLSSGVVGFETFAGGIKRERDAVEAALSLSHP
jgi:transposase